MILHYFMKKENKDKKNANRIYISLINLIKEIFDNKDLMIKRDFNSSFELSAILLSTLFFIFKNKFNNKHINQYLMDLFIADLDLSLRELGISDMSIGKYVKSYVKKLYYRMFKIEKIIENKNFEEFEKYIENINIHYNLNSISNLSKLLFLTINNLLKIPKSEQLSEFTLLNLSN